HKSLQRIELRSNYLNRWTVNCLDKSEKRGAQTDKTVASGDSDVVYSAWSCARKRLRGGVTRSPAPRKRGWPLRLRLGGWGRAGPGQRAPAQRPRIWGLRPAGVDPQPL